MSTPLLMPSLSPTMEEGVIAQWHVRLGDRVEQGTLLCSIETDKTTVDYESFDEGYVRHIAIAAGSKAKVNQLIALLTDSADESFEIPENVSTANADSKETSEQNSSQAPLNPQATTLVHEVQSEQISSNQSSRVRISPLAKRIAQEKGIAYQNIKGSGPGGRIVKADIERTQSSLANDSRVHSSISSAVGAVSPSTNQGPLPGPAPAPAPVQTQPQDVLLTKMRKTIGERLLSSWNGAPAFFLSMRYDVSSLLELRRQLNNETGYKISINDLVIKATAMALRSVPKVNASFLGDHIRYHGNVDISIAVAIDDGLITPIVRHADQKTLGNLSAEIRTLAQKAHAGTLNPDEYQGGSFTVSNLGMFGVHHFTSILNPPQAAILAVAGIHNELYRASDGSIQDRKVMECTLTADHRVIDGALAAQFMQALKKFIENPATLML